MAQVIGLLLGHGHLFGHQIDIFDILAG
jgi:hypothetical protein